MAVEVEAQAEALPTFIAFVRFLLSVDSLVGVEVRAAAEALATVSTLIWLLSCVNSLVGLEVCPLLCPFLLFYMYEFKVDHSSLNNQ